MTTPKPILFKTSSKWRNWLKKNHNKKSEVYLLHYKKHIKKKGVKYQEALEEALCFGWIDGKLKRIDDESFMLRYSPRKPKSVWSKVNKDKVLELIKKKRMTSAGIAIIDEAKRNGMWDKAYTNKKRDKMPQDLKEALKKDKIAYSNFKNFANSYRNMYIGWVTGAKRPVTRERRIKELVKRSKLNKKP
jgi:uncharacterized protein YdeI (YjbR/CyaY-like superfamily)